MVRIEAENLTDWAVERGFSGGPVFDHRGEAVTGIVALRDNHRGGHLLPISYPRAPLRPSLFNRGSLRAGSASEDRPLVRSRSTRRGSPTTTINHTCT